MKTKKFGQHRVILSERLESPAQQQSQEKYLLPRNCWLKFTAFQIRPALLDKNQKLRIRISVPNSARVVRTSPVPLDEALFSHLQQNVNQAGFAELMLDVTVLLEYKHDVRYGHQNNLEFDVEVLSPIISRSKNLGSGVIDLTTALQKPLQTILMFRKDNVPSASVKISLYSLNISKTSPPITKNNQVEFVSDSDSESVPPITAHFEKTISGLFKQNKILIMDDRTTQGHTLLQGASLNDFVLPVSDPQMIQLIFDVAEQEYIPQKEPLRFIVAGDDYFICYVLKTFLSMHDRGVLTSSSFSFIHIPLVSDKAKFAYKISDVSKSYSSHFLSGNWFKVFLEDSTVQNVSSVIDQEVKFLVETPLVPFQCRITDVLITTTSDQFVVPMFLMLEIGELANSKNDKMSLSNVYMLKLNFFKKDGSKSISIRVSYMNVKQHNTSLLANWKIMQSSIGSFPIQDKGMGDSKKHKATKIVLSLGKSQNPLTIKIDDNSFKDVISMTLTIRDQESALNVFVPP